MDTLWHPFWETLSQLVSAESLRISMLTSAFFAQRARSWMWRAGRCPVISQALVHTGERVLLLRLLPCGGHLLDHSWHWRMGAIPRTCLFHHLLPLLLSLPAIRGICLVKLINLLMMQYPFPYKPLSWKWAALCASQEERFRSGVALWIGTCPSVLGEWLAFCLWCRGMLGGVLGESGVDFWNFQNDGTDSQIWRFGTLMIDRAL